MMLDVSACGRSWEYSPETESDPPEPSLELSSLEPSSLELSSLELETVAIIAWESSLTSTSSKLSAVSYALLAAGAHAGGQERLVDRRQPGGRERVRARDRAHDDFS